MLSNKNLTKIAIVFLLSIQYKLYCPHGEPRAEVGPPEIGNFALLDSQQIGPLFSFGQDIIDKGIKQSYLFIDYFKGDQKHFADAVPSFLYGVTDKFSLFLMVPFATSYRETSSHSAGIADIFLQGEYAFYQKETERYADLGTFVANISVPTGSVTKQPPTGFGSPTFFLGGTFSRLYIDWYGFVSAGTLLTTEHKQTKFGNQFLYQGGLGRNIISKPSKFIFSWLVELNGFYSQKDKIRGLINSDTGVADPGGATDPDSGGTLIYITPSLWFSTKRLIVQFGVGVPLVQKLFGNQRKNKYVALTNIGWTWNF